MLTMHRNVTHCKLVDLLFLVKYKQCFILLCLNRRLRLCAPTGNATLLLSEDIDYVFIIILNPSL